MKPIGLIALVAVVAGCTTVQPLPNEDRGQAPSVTPNPQTTTTAQTTSSEPTYDVVAGGPRPDVGIAVGSNGAGVSVGLGGLSVGVGTGGHWSIGAWF